MNSICRQIRQRAAAEGAEGIRQRVDQTPAVASHVAGCAGCQRAFDALNHLDTALAELQPIDAPDEAVAALLARVVAKGGQAAAQADDTTTRRAWLGRLVERLARLRGWLTTPTVLRPLAMASVALVALSVALWIPSLHQSPGTDVALSTVNAPQAETTGDYETRASLEALGYVGSSSEDSSSQAWVNQRLRSKREEVSAKKRELRERLSLLEHKDGQRSNAATALSEGADVISEPTTPAAQEVPRSSARQLPMPRLPASTPPAKASRKQVDKTKRGAGVASELEELRVDDQLVGSYQRLEIDASIEENIDSIMEEGIFEDEISVTAELPVLVERRVSASTTISQIEIEDTPAARSPLPVFKPKTREQKERDEQAQGTGGFNQSVEADNSRIEEMRLEAQRLDKELVELEGGGDSGLTSTLGKSIASRSTVAAAAAFLAERERVAPLTFQPATGYWANTYLPGDPARRFLEARLAQRGLDALRPYHQQTLRLHDASRQPIQPFDPPRSAALALYVDMDRHGAAGPARTLVQVGLRATDRHRGLRVPLTLAVVIDLAENLSGNQVEHVRALLRALLATVESGDRVHLLFAGRDVPMLPPALFRHGAVMVALEEALVAPKIVARLDLADHLAQAQQRLLAATTEDSTPETPGATAAGEPSAALGATGALIVSARDELSERLEIASHRSALAGVPVSVVALGTKVDRESYVRVALAGQGGLRHLIAAADAEDLIDRELASLGRVVARALRLNIRLAPGVELIDVIGSHRLDLAATARVRAAEQSIDQMVQRDLGIRADRGEDDDGIQILIPAFYAGDAHVVLLDVVVPGSGKVADVSVRYKDLVRSKNGSAHARLKLGRAKMRRPAAGDRSIRSVRKSLLAAKLQTDLEAAAEALRQGRPADATQRLSALRDLLAGLGAIDPGWASDRDVINDLAVLHEYLAVLAAGAADDARARNLLADSLRIAAVRKILRVDDLGIDAAPQSSDTRPDGP